MGRWAEGSLRPLGCRDSMPRPLSTAGGPHRVFCPPCPTQEAVVARPAGSQQQLHRSDGPRKDAARNLVVFPRPGQSLLRAARLSVSQRPRRAPAFDVASRCKGLIRFPARLAHFSHRRNILQAVATLKQLDGVTVDNALRREVGVAEVEEDSEEEEEGGEEGTSEEEAEGAPKAAPVTGQVPPPKAESQRQPSGKAKAPVPPKAQTQGADRRRAAAAKARPNNASAATSSASAKRASRGGAAAAKAEAPGRAKSSGAARHKATAGGAGAKRASETRPVGKDGGAPLASPAPDDDGDDADDMASIPLRRLLQSEHASADAVCE